MYYLKNTNFWMFGLFFFFYFFIMGAYFPFFPIWLHDINHISKSDTGIIFAAISLFSLLFQPLFGLLSDKLGLRKYLLWIITGMLVMFAPFFIFIFGPLLQYNILVGSLESIEIRAQHLAVEEQQGRQCLTMRGDRNLALVRQPGQKCLDFAAAQGCRVTHTVETDEGTNPVDISLFGS